VLAWQHQAAAAKICGGKAAAAAMAAINVAAAAGEYNQGSVWHIVGSAAEHLDKSAARHARASGCASLHVAANNSISLAQSALV